MDPPFAPDPLAALWPPLNRPRLLFLTWRGLSGVAIATMVVEGFVAFVHDFPVLEACDHLLVLVVSLVDRLSADAPAHLLAVPIQLSESCLDIGHLLTGLPAAHRPHAIQARAGV